MTATPQQGHSESPHRCADCGAEDELYYHDGDAAWVCENPGFCIQNQRDTLYMALAELVRLKDGPRDDAYRAAKDAAWQAARGALR